MIVIPEVIGRSDDSAFVLVIVDDLDAFDFESVASDHIQSVVYIDCTADIDWKVDIGQIIVVIAGNECERKH